MVEDIGVVKFAQQGMNKMENVGVFDDWWLLVSMFDGLTFKRVQWMTLKPYLGFYCLKGSPKQTNKQTNLAWLYYNESWLSSSQQSTLQCLRSRPRSGRQTWKEVASGIHFNHNVWRAHTVKSSGLLSRCQGGLFTRHVESKRHDP